MSKYTQAIILVLLSTLTSTAAQVFFKLTSPTFAFSFSGIFNIWLWLGFLAYIISAALLILAFRHGELSVLTPLQSVEFIWTLLAAWLILQEVISLQNVIGISLVISGVVLLTIPGGKNEHS